MSKVYALRDQAEVKYTSKFLDSNESKQLFDELKTKVPWAYGVYNMYGKSVKTPRLLYAMRDKDVDISKSYSVTGSMEWLPLVENIKKRIEKETGHSITYAQLNYYRSGDDYIGPHSDKEVEKGDIIASLSLGSSRKFIIKHNDGLTKQEIILEDGSMLIMNDNAAKTHYKHEVPKMKNVGERINITFRPK